MRNRYKHWNKILNQEFGKDQALGRIKGEMRLLCKSFETRIGYLEKKFRKEICVGDYWEHRYKFWYDEAIGYSNRIIDLKKEVDYWKWYAKFYAVSSLVFMTLAVILAFK